MNPNQTLIETVAEGAARGAVESFGEWAAIIEEREKAYRDRNLLAVAYLAEYAAAEGSERVGWYEHGGEGWAVIYADLNAGQVSWHVPEEMVPEFLPQRHPDVYDGHDRDEKNAVLRETYLGEADE